jgi:hypothetical protein
METFSYFFLFHEIWIKMFAQSAFNISFSHFLAQLDQLSHFHILVL